MAGNLEGNEVRRHEEEGAQRAQGITGYSTDFGFCSEMIYLCTVSDGEVTDILTYIFKRISLAFVLRTHSGWEEGETWRVGTRLCRNPGVRDGGSRWIW